MHPTVQFERGGAKFFDYPGVHLKIYKNGNNSKLILNSIYKIPKSKIEMKTVPGLGAMPSFGSISHGSLHLKNFLPDTPAWVQMKKICLPRGKSGGFLLTANPVDENGRDVADGPTGYSRFEVVNDGRINSLINFL